MSIDWNFLGNTWAPELLQGQIANGSLRHAYLFTGPDGIGRRTLALRLAQAVNCEEPPDLGGYCNECRACKGIAKMQHTDLHILEVQDGDRQIKVEAVRELSRMLALTPYESKMQIALLLDFDQATVHAANALLKTLEEPSERVLLLLTAESAESLPATIASRCEVLRLRQMNSKALEEGLKVHIGADAEKCQLIANLSAGKPGIAIRLASDEDALMQKSEWVQDALRMIGASHVERFSFAEDVSKDRNFLLELLGNWLIFWRDLLMKKNNINANLVHLDKEADIKATIEGMKSEDIQAFISQLQETIFSLKRNANARLAMESLLLSLPKKAATL